MAKEYIELEKQIYPLTIVLDRYTGVYSGGYFTAWNCDFMEVPEEIDSDDVTCYEIWDEIREGRFSRKNAFGKPIKVGVGNTPQEAIENLRGQIQAAKMEGDGE